MSSQCKNISAILFLTLALHHIYALHTISTAWSMEILHRRYGGGK